MVIPIPPLAEFELLFLVFLRVSAMLIMIPMFGDRTVPARVKAGLAVILTLIIFPVIKTDSSYIVSENLLILFLKIAGEVMIGALIGLIGRFIFIGIQLCGQIIGFQMGFAIANIVDPVTSAQVSIIAELYYLIAILLFLAFDMHHVFIGAIAESFTIIPPFALRLKGELIQTLVISSSQLFLVAVKIGAPVIAALTLLNVSLAIIARTVPQINIFIVGFPLQIMTGLFFVGLGTALFSLGMEKVFQVMAGQLMTIIRTIP